MESEYIKIMKAFNLELLNVLAKVKIEAQKIIKLVTKTGKMLDSEMDKLSEKAVEMNL